MHSDVGKVGVERTATVSARKLSKTGILRRGLETFPKFWLKLPIFDDLEMIKSTRNPAPCTVFAQKLSAILGRVTGWLAAQC
jgi:hypothetical protein